MVQGKPNLTFGSAAQAAAPSSRARASRTGTREAESFASYLPGLETGSPGKASPVRTAVQNARQMLENIPAQPPQAAPSRGTGAQGKARMHLGFLPDNYVSGSANEFAGNGGNTPTVNLPTGKASRAEARALARPGSQGMMDAYAANPAMQQRISAKSGIRLSGQPITGRRDIGMVDTRKNPPGKTSLTSRGVPAYSQAKAAQQRETLAPPGSDAFSSFSAYTGGAQRSAQSFVEHGFSSKNAKLAMRKLGYDVREQPSLTTYARQLEPDPYSLKAGGGAGTKYGSTSPLSFAGGDDAARTAVLTASHRKRADARGTSLVPEFQAMANRGLGNLAAKFESGSDGIAAIGYDRKGGTSYGKYQIASRVGTMRAFLDYLQEKAPDLAKRLESAGPANTGGRNGGMPSEWRKIASEDPARFEVLQSDFIRTSHFEPAMQAIESATGVSFDGMPPALQEVLFSTAVQHGPAGATRIVSQALKRVDAERLQSKAGRPDRNTQKTGEQLITHIYNLRAGQFMSSTSRVQSAVRNRLKQEMREALQMLT